MEKLKELIEKSRTLREKATQGEWGVVREYPLFKGPVIVEKRLKAFICECGQHPISIEDARLIVHAVNTLPILLDELERLLEIESKYKPDSAPGFEREMRWYGTKPSRLDEGRGP